MRKNKIIRTLSVFALLLTVCLGSVNAQINTDRVFTIGKNALYFEDYILSIQYFNQVIKSKPQLAEPYLYRGLAKFYLDDYSGAERDLTISIEKNPFIWMSYQIRGACYQNLGNYEAAIRDYNKGLEFRPEDKQFLFNKGIALAQSKEYDSSLSAFDQLILLHPKFVPVYLTKGTVHAELGDTVLALENFNKALELNKYYAPAYERRAILFFQQEKYEDALIDIDEAIRLETNQLGYHINRGLIRFYLNDLRGAMSDYDMVVKMNGNNTVARFNRGLLRASVGDAEGALVDFDKVIELEPDNFIALYNKVLLNYELQKYSQALSDLNLVLKEYPNFLQGYYFRSDIKRKMNDLRGAEKDYWDAQDLEKKLERLRAQGKVVTGKEVLNAGQSNDSTEDKIRESSDKDIAKFNRLVVYDKEEEAKSQYQNEIRGRVQDRQVKVDLEPPFVVTYYESIDELERFSAHYAKLLHDFNKRREAKMQLKLTNRDVLLTDAQADYHFTSIDDYSTTLNANPHSVVSYFLRGMDYFLLRDYSEAIENFSQSIDLDSTYTLAYFNRAVARYKQIEVENARKGNADPLDLMLTPSSDSFHKIGSLPVVGAEIKEDNSLYRYSAIISDYDTVIRLAPEFVYAYFNRGNIHCLQKDYASALDDYGEAISINPEFAEAYFNRGLTRLYLGQTALGIEDLSKAGELGMINAYSIIKKMNPE